MRLGQYKQCNGCWKKARPRNPDLHRLGREVVPAEPRIGRPYHMLTMHECAALHKHASALRLRMCESRAPAAPCSSVELPRREQRRMTETIASNATSRV